MFGSQRINITSNFLFVHELVLEKEIVLVFQDVVELHLEVFLDPFKLYLVLKIEIVPTNSITALLKNLQYGIVKSEAGGKMVLRELDRNVSLVTLFEL